MFLKRLSNFYISSLLETGIKSFSIFSIFSVLSQGSEMFSEHGCGRAFHVTFFQWTVSFKFVFYWQVPVVNPINNCPIYSSRSPKILWTLQAPNCLSQAKFYHGTHQNISSSTTSYCKCLLWSITKLLIFNPIINYFDPPGTSRPVI